MAQMLVVLARGGDVSIMRRHPAFGTLCAKFERMRRALSGKNQT